MIQQLTEMVLGLNRESSGLYLRQKKLRTDYRRSHPTMIIAFVCSDGRVQFVRMTGIPMGHARVERNIGAKFRTGWPTERGRLNQLVSLAWEDRRRCLFIAGYHFSKSDTHLGCAGSGYDTAVAKATADQVRAELMYGYRGGIQGNYAITVGIETDAEALVFHGRDGVALATPEMGEPDDARLAEVARSLYPDMEDDLVRDLVPLMRGNIEHVREMRAETKPPVKFDHTERVLAVGQGFDDWLLTPNLALIVNDGDPRLDDSIATAAGIILKNRDAGRIPDTHALNLVAVPYFNDAERPQAVLHAQYLGELCRETLKERYPSGIGFFRELLCVMDWETRLLEPIETP